MSGLGNNLLGEWAQGENRGGRPYKPPNGWIGYGLNVLNKYDNGNNDWLACNGRQGEWCIAYHGACNGQSSDNVKKGIKSILETNLRPGGGQAYANHDDANHPGQKVGKGVYCSPEPSVIDGYSGIMNINGHNYKASFMLRVRPDKLRYSNSRQDYWVPKLTRNGENDTKHYIALQQMGWTPIVIWECEVNKHFIETMDKLTKDIKKEWEQ